MARVEDSMYRTAQIIGTATTPMQRRHRGSGAIAHAVVADS